jgi:hypothetical protein
MPTVPHGGQLMYRAGTPPASPPSEGAAEAMRHLITAHYVTAHHVTAHHGPGRP